MPLTARAVDPTMVSDCWNRQSSFEAEPCQPGRLGLPWLHHRVEPAGTVRWRHTSLLLSVGHRRLKFASAGLRRLASGSHQSLFGQKRTFLDAPMVPRACRRVNSAKVRDTKCDRARSAGCPGLSVVVRFLFFMLARPRERRLNAGEEIPGLSTWGRECLHEGLAAARRSMTFQSEAASGNGRS